MGHDVHFLERLERVDDAQVSVALSLYNDGALVRAMLALAGLPDDAERVALALAHAQPSPHAIVARDGSFVTCLAAGMSTGPWPVLSREQLDGLRVRAERRRERVATMIDGAAEFEDVAARLIRRGPRVSREDIELALAFRPLLARDYLRHGFTLFDVTHDLIKRLHRANPRRPTAPQRKQLKQLYNGVWSVGHLAALSWYDASILEVVPEEFLGSLSPSWACTRHRFLPAMVRGVWAAARLGPQLLRHYKARYRNTPTMTGNLDSALAIAAIGLRHRKLRAECIKVLSRETRFDPAAERILTELPGLLDDRRLMDQVLVDVLEHPEDFAENMLENGRNIALHIPTRDSVQPIYQSPDDVPDDIARAVLVNLPAEVFTDARARSVMASMMPWLATAELPELYLPESYHETYHIAGYAHELSLALVRADLACDGRRQPVRVEKTPKRNARCPCGSGRKYKHCCATTSETA